VLGLRALQVLQERAGEVRPAQGKIHDGLQKAQLVAGIVPDAIDPAPVDGAVLQQPPQAVGQLDLAGPVRRRGFQRREDVRREDVAADDRQVGRRLLPRGLFHHVADPVHAVADLLRVDDPVGADVVFRHALDGEHGAVQLVEDVHHLPHRRRVGVDHVVAQDHREGLVAHELLRDQHRVAEAERLPLADVRDVDQVRDLADLLELLRLAAGLEKRLEFDRHVEVILDGVLAAPSDEDDVVDPGRDRLLDAVLNDRLVDQRQHLFRLRLGGG
jgi:hypothetical protein